MEIKRQDRWRRGKRVMLFNDYFLATVATEVLRTAHMSSYHVKN